MANKIQLPITKQKEIDGDAIEISFGLENKEFKFKAGQYIQISIPKLLYPDPRGNSRVFSLVSSPNKKDEISIAFRDSGSGFKRTLTESPEGTLVEIEGPHGFFTLPKKDKKVVFIAGGIGITPCLSMIRFANEENYPSPIKLLYSNKDESSAPYLEELKEMPNESFNFVLKNRFGRIDEGFIQESIDDINDYIWYVVGPPGMVSEVKHILSNLNIEDEKIYFEEFEGL